MLKKLLIAGAVGASVFGVAAASASALSLSTNGQAVQQSDNVSATCTTGTVQVNDVVKNGDVVAIRVFQQDIEPQCSNAEMQAVLTLQNNSTVPTDIVQIPTSNESYYGYDFYLPVTNVTAGQLKSTQLTIAGQIVDHTVNTIVAYASPATLAPYHTAP